MVFDQAKIFTEENLSEHLVLGHPYYPKRPAFLLVKRGSVQLREQINVYTLTEFSIILIDSNSVYEILNYSRNLEVLIVAYNREFVERLNFKFNRLNAYRTIRKEFKEVYHSSEEEFLTIWKNLQNSFLKIGI